MNIHEYQAKKLFKQYGIPVPEQILADNKEKVREAAEKLGGNCVVKAQVHSGGRGKAGGVKLASSPEDAEKIAEKMLGMKLVTKQSGPEGKIVHKLLVTACADIEKEYYLSITMDMSTGCPVIIASGSGGTEIEELAKNQPEAIAHISVPIENGFKNYHGYETAQALGVNGQQAKELISILRALYKLFIDKDCSLVEVNPLVLLKDGHFTALDAKVNFDDNGLIRHPELLELDDPQEKTREEIKASEAGLSYIPLDGNVACLVNGAGLAMATMDMIKSYGAEPANFLDVGGSASVEKVTAAFEILLSSERVNALLVNIFGGIMKCDVIASGIIEAAKVVGIKVPLIVRLEGTNSEIGKMLLKESGMDIIPASGFSDAVKKAVEAARGVIR